MSIEICLTNYTAKIKAGKEIGIPPEARYFRKKSSRILFYRGKPETSRDNGYTAIESGADSIVFPDFREHRYYTNYGPVKFIKKHLNQLG